MSHYSRSARRQCFLGISILTPACRADPDVVPFDDCCGELVLRGLTERTWASWPTRAVLVVVSAIVAISSLPIGSVAPMLSVTAQEEAPASGEEVIVVLEDDADPIVAAQELGVEPTHIYDGVFTGFAATMPAAAVAEARASDAVRQISRDGRVQAEDQIVGTGVLRVGVPHTPGSQNLAITSPIDADVAILDTGVDRGGDLRVSGGASCVNDKHKKKGKGKNHHKGHKHKKKDDKSKSWEDDNGHGTHVASIAAALDNDQGIVGVAPGARVWAVKVLDENGGGSFSDVICGLNWVVNH